ncbi:MAG: restriction endonuclease subunit S [Actinomycetota bacterium]|nr:restriction endonuclease subunit S [Actinomycetota bacterium]
MVTLGEVAEFINGFAFKPEDWHDDGLPIIRIQNLTDPSKPINLTTRAVAEKYYVQRGEILVSWSATLGVFVWDRTDRALVNQHIFRVVPDTGIVEPDFLRHMLHGAIGAMQRHLHGATMQHVNRTEFLSTEIPLPPLDEQRRITTILDHADTLLNARRESLALVGGIGRAVFLEMFDGEYERKPISEVCELMVDCVNRTAPTVEHETPYKMLRTTNVRHGRVNTRDVRFVSAETFARWNRRATPQRGDVILTREAPVGEAGILDSDEQFFLGQRLFLYRADPKQMTSEFLLACFESPLLRAQFDRLGSGSTVKHLPLPACQSFLIPAPPIEVQLEYSARVRRLTEVAKSVRVAIENMDELFASLQSRAFTGQL